LLKDIFINIDEIEKELKNMQEVLESFKSKFSLFSQTIAYIFDKIKRCNTLQEAHDYFDVLDKIQIGLACLLFKYNIEIPCRLERFVRDFDNFEEAKYIYFDRIKTGEYKF